MGKKYIVINGKKHYIKDETGDNENADPDQEEGTEENEDSTDEGTEGGADEGADEGTNEEGTEDNSEQRNIQAEAKQVANKILQNISADIGRSNEIKSLNEKIDKLSSQVMPEDSRLKAILNGKDLDSDQLTKDEKIVGFYHACISNNHLAVKALSEGTSADGGYLVPDEFRAEVIRALGEISLPRQICRVVPMKRKTLNAVSVVSGPEVYWTDEGATKTTTTVHFGQPTLTAYKLAAILYSSDELIEDSDSIDVVNLVIQLFAERMAHAENRAFGQGSGSGQPTGLDTAQGASTITGPSCSGNLDFDDIIELEYSLGVQYRPTAVYISHSENIKELRKLKDGNDNYIWQPGSPVSGTPATFNGKRIYEFDHIAVDKLYFGDFKRGYWFGDRKKLTVLLSQHTTEAFTKDETAIRVVERIGGNVVWGDSIKCLDSIP